MKYNFMKQSDHFSSCRVSEKHWQLSKDLNLFKVSVILRQTPGKNVSRGVSSEEILVWVPRV